MKPSTFAECFCAKHNIPPEQYARAVFNRALYRRTHLFKWLLRFFEPHYFAADFDLIYAVANLRRVRDFGPEIDRFNQHFANRGLRRRTFCLRVSTTRLKAIMRETLPRKSSSAARELVEETVVSATPFAIGTLETSEARS